MQVRTNFSETGAWVISIYKNFSDYNLNDSVFDSYEEIILAGKTGLLLSAIRKLGRVEDGKFDVLRKMAGLKPRECTRVLELLNKIGKISVNWHDASEFDVKVDSVEVVSSDKHVILDTIGQLFYELKPNHQAQSLVSILIITLNLPSPEHDVTSTLVKSGLTESAVKGAIKHLLGFRLLSKTIDTERGSHLLFNPSTFRANAEDAFAAINALSPNQRQQALEMIEYVKVNPGIPFPPNFSKDIADLLITCGLIDTSVIVAEGGRAQKEFPTTPYVWAVHGTGDFEDDIVDDAKVLLNSLRYGQLYSRTGRGKIFDPYVLVNALIEKGSVGAATAIGEDYLMPLSRGIVSIVESRLYPGRYHMELRKEDVAEAVRDVLLHKGIVPNVVDDKTIERTLKQQGEFVSPEQVRVKKKLPPLLIEERDGLAFHLRTYRRGR